MSAAPEPLLVRWGIRYFRELSKGHGPIAAGDGVHVLNPEERAALRRIQRNAIIRAAIAGALSTLVAAVAEVLAHPLLGADPDHASFEQNVRFWGIVGGATVLASIIEILFLYWDGLRAVHALSRAAGLELFPDQDDDAALAGAMARAALELPNPTGRRHGVDPWREASRLRLVIASIVYKLKVSVTNFAAKALVRRVLGRAFVRTWLPFVAVPITAAWNAVVCWFILREARIRAMGPSAAREMIGLVWATAPADLDDETRHVAVRAVASCIVRTEDMHPNLAAVLREVIARAPAMNDTGDLDVTSVFLDRLAKLGVQGDPRQRFVLRVLAVASVIDGRLTRAEKTLLVDARRACGLAPDLSAVETLRVAFLQGDPVEARIETL
jgi:hypothetical protein